MIPNEPRTNNPGLANYVQRTTGIAIFLIVVLFFTAVHFYYATSALLEPLAVFLLFLFLFCLAMSLGCLQLCAHVGPGALPTRFSAARMETFIRAELQRVVEKARGAQRATEGAGEAGVDGKAAAFSTSTPSPAVTAEEKKRRWQDLDDAEERQLANAASAAALTQRASPAAAEAAMEQAAMEARLRMHEARLSSSTSGSDRAEGERGGSESEDGDVDEAAAARRERRRLRRQRHPRPQPGDGVHQADGSIHNSADDEADREAVQELPAYMPDMMRLRRQRKVRRGLEVVRVSEAARRMLRAIDSDDFDQKREEMGYLIPGANWCRFCNFYQMNETRHCKACNRCVYRTKLHCICCGSCIGYANSKYYVLFLFYLAMALIMANFLDLFCINWGFTYFFKATGESNSIYYLVFVYSYAIVVIVVTLLLQYLLAAGRNVGLLTELQREQREELESIQLRNSGEQYQMILSERTTNAHDDGSSSPEQAREPFIWSRAMNTVGEGLPLPLWFWPVPTRPAVKEMDDPAGFWDNLKEAIRIRLCSVADEDDVFFDEDDVVDGLAAVTQGAASASPAAASAAPAVEAAQVVPMPHRAKSTDVTVVPVAVAVPSPVVAAVAPAAVNGVAVADGPTAVRPPTVSPTSPSPPIAKAAPSPPKKAD